MIVTFLVIPIGFAVTYTTGEVRTWLAWGNRRQPGQGAATPGWIVALPVCRPPISTTFGQNTSAARARSGELIQAVSGAHIGQYLPGRSCGRRWAPSHLLLTLLFMLIALFFVYRDGVSFSKQIDMLGERILPNRWERISRVVPATISSTVMGMTLIAIGEGIVLGLAYWVAGVPSPVTLGVLTGVMALIPGGAPLSFTLVSIYLLASGSHVAGVGLFVWGTVELFIVDKTLRPKLVGGPIKLPFLPTFFGLVGGVKTMGFLGLFIGPVLMALIVAIWREWIHEARNADTSESGPQIVIDEQAPPSKPVPRVAEG